MQKATSPYILRSTSLLFILFSFVLISCDPDDDEPIGPEILTPIENVIYYPDQLITIKWSVPDSSRAIDLQMLVFSDSAEFLNIAEHLSETAVSYTFTNQTSCQFYTEFAQKAFYVFRVKYSNSAKWSKAHFFRVYPYAELEARIITLATTFDFDAAQGDLYYSGYEESVEVFDLEQAIVSAGYDLSRLEFVRPLSGTVSDESDHPEHIDRVTFGFKDDTESFPFDPLGDVGSMRYVQEIVYSPFGGKYRDLYAELGVNPMKLEMVYFLDPFNDTSDMVGIAHSITITMNLKCYFSK
jgi:hypothetical protein